MLDNLIGTVMQNVIKVALLLALHACQSEAPNRSRDSWLPGYDISSRGDKVLIRLFQDHRPELDQLVSMATEDMLATQHEGFPPPIDIDLFLPVSGRHSGEKFDSEHAAIDDARLEIYKRLLRSLGIRVSMFISWNDDDSTAATPTITFVDSRVAWDEAGGGGYRTGLIYSDSPRVDSMFDSLSDGRVGTRRAFQALDKRWFLFVEVLIP